MALGGRFGRGSGGHLINRVDSALELLPDRLVHHPLPIHRRLALERRRYHLDAAYTQPAVSQRGSGATNGGGT